MHFDQFQAASGVVFNKGHGIALMIDHIHCKLSEGNILVCGDSETDLPMLEVCLGRNPLNVYTIWVTRKDALKEKVKISSAAFPLFILSYLFIQIKFPLK